MLVHFVSDVKISIQKCLRKRTQKRVSALIKVQGFHLAISSFPCQLNKKSKNHKLVFSQFSFLNPALPGFYGYWQY